MLDLDDLIAMDNSQLHSVLRAGHPLDLNALADTEYLGVDLSLPGWMHRLLWRTFRKTFHLDPRTQQLRGWNVRMEQNSVDGPAAPMTGPRGGTLTFGHYHVRDAAEQSFPRGWTGGHFLDYRHAGNARLDVARLGCCPLVAVNQGRSDLLLGWEVFRVGPLWLPLPDYWALRRQGDLSEVVAPPRSSSRS